MSVICGFNAYTASVRKLEETKVFIAKTEQGDRLVCVGGELGFVGEPFWWEGTPGLLADLNHHNAEVLRRVFPFTAPCNGLANGCSLGLGDRLGLAGMGHLEALRSFPSVFPVLAQQSIRELKLTGRTYEEVLDCASYSVFKAGYALGFGADGDHLKTDEEIEYALECGYSMITLDCTDYIQSQYSDLSANDPALKAVLNSGIAELYLGEPISIKGYGVLNTNAMEIARAQLIYGPMLDFSVDVFGKYISCRPVDFEISIDETIYPTTPLQHYFVASELIRRGVKFVSLAPRFCGEFQKGIDYIGDTEQFSAELIVHAAIASQLGYKLSIHSGSDKFKVFPAIGSITRGKFHLKTSGTSWLEAIRLIAMYRPGLFRELYRFSRTNVKEATKYYHVTSNFDLVQDISMLADDKLPALLDLDDVRQLMHITYGLILQAKGQGAANSLGAQLRQTLKEYGAEYTQLISRHIGRHLESLLKFDE